MDLNKLKIPSMSSKKVHKEYYTGGQVRSEFIMDDNTGLNGLKKQYGYEGKVTSQVQIKNGVKDGTETWYDKQGRVIRQVPYVNGRIHGMFKDFYKNGTLMATVQYRNGIKNGIGIIYAKDGSVYKRIMYKNDRIAN